MTIDEYFSRLEDRAWTKSGLSVYVGVGALDITVARGRLGRAAVGQLRFYLKGKRIGRDDARKLVERWYGADLRSA